MWLLCPLNLIFILDSELEMFLCGVSIPFQDTRNGWGWVVLERRDWEGRKGKGYYVGYVLSAEHICTGFWTGSHPDLMHSPLIKITLNRLKMACTFAFISNKPDLQITLYKICNVTSFIDQLIKNSHRHKKAKWNIVNFQRPSTLWMTLMTFN